MKKVAMLVLALTLVLSFSAPIMAEGSQTELLYNHGNVVDFVVTVPENIPLKAHEGVAGTFELTELNVPLSGEERVEVRFETTGRGTGGMGMTVANAAENAFVAYKMTVEEGKYDELYSGTIDGRYWYASEMREAVICSFTEQGETKESIFTAMPTEMTANGIYTGTLTYSIQIG